MIIATLYKVTIGYDWSDGTASWTCGSLEGARRFVKKEIGRGGVCWYSIMGHQYMPCHEDDPLGQLYIGLIHTEYNEVAERNDLDS